MLQPGRVNLIDLSDVENMDVRNLAIAEMLRGILMRQQDIYDAATKDKRRRRRESTDDKVPSRRLTNFI